MMSLLTYQQWDAIADSYIPLMAVLSLIHVVHVFLSGSSFSKVVSWANVKSLFVRVLTITACTAWVYGLMYLDKHLNIWPSLSINNQVLDYSTHTALALVFSTYLFCANLKRHPARAYLSLVSMGLYLLLMKYQNYHTFADMLTTTVVVLPPMYLLLNRMSKRHC